MKGTLLVKNVKHLVTCDADDRLLDGVNVFIRDGVIESIGQNEETAADVIDASNMVMYPGLINTHHHLYQTFSRNLPQVQNMELFPWLKTLYEIWKHVDEDVVYYSSLTGMGELLKTGCTTCLDHHYVFPGTVGGGLLDAQFHAADELGMRFHATRGSMDLSVKDGGLPPDSVVQSVDEILKDSEEAVARYHDGSRYSMHQVALAPCSPFSVTGELLRESAVLARKLKVRLHTHLAETKDEEQYTLSRFGMRPLEYMESLGWVGPDVWYAHGIHFTEGELKRLADTGTGVAHCPVSNMKLSSGVALIPQMLKLGVPVGLAVDGSASNDGSNLLEEMRVAYLLHRLSWSQEAPDGYDILKMATRGSARILGREELGRIEVGMAADFFLVNLNRIEMVGAQFDPKSVLCTVGLKGCVDYTVVNGKIVVKDGRLAGVDEEKIVEKANAVVEEYISR
ncbi:8-oxoguanine deaminase [Clostridium sp. FS41]|uniref:8-oxoguanine deaminase n=1 Tax=Clostridium sp. FS41 TaxID=1609975 RepID=UPI0005D3CD9E|nr:8-oxoguanine deaminase [Clostridium sp. FS41]KJJ75571.1 hydroxydechloroatrazine ethylaminohydrolase [Clostridium sp. FS41]